MYEGKSKKNQESGWEFFITTSLPSGGGRPQTKTLP